MAAVFAGFFKQIRMETKKGNMKFFMWAAIVVAFVLAFFMLVLNVYFVIHHHQCFKTFSVCGAYMALLVVTSVLNIITMMISTKYTVSNNSDDVSDFPMPRVFCIGKKELHPASRRHTGESTLLRSSDDKRNETDSDNGDQGHNVVRRHVGQRVGCVSSDSCSRLCKVSLLGLAGYSISLFVILASYHGVYIILSLVASPVMALSHVTFYITATASLVAFLALFLKGIEESKCDERNGTKQLVRNVCKYAPSIFAVFFFILCVFGFGLFYFFFSIMVQDYHHGGNYLSIVGMFLPSLLLGFTGYSGKKLVDCIAKQEAEQTDL